MLHDDVCLGRRPPRRDPRTPALAAYRRAGAPLPPPAAERDWTPAGLIDWGMMRNDQIGDCTAAAAAHAVQTWTARAHGGPMRMTDDQVVAFYAASAGYVPGNPATDQGGVELDVLQHWASKGMATPDQAPDVLCGFAVLNPHDPTEVKQAIEIFGGVYIGLQLPLAWQDAEVWGAPSGDPAAAEPDSWGGHAVWVPGYTLTGPVCVTWGARKQITWAGWLKYADEAYALLDRDWLDTTGHDAHGYDLDALRADLGRLVG